MSPKFQSPGDVRNHLLHLNKSRHLLVLANDWAPQGYTCWAVRSFARRGRSLQLFRLNNPPASGQGLLCTKETARLFSCVPAHFSHVAFGRHSSIRPGILRLKSYASLFCHTSSTCKATLAWCFRLIGAFCPPGYPLWMAGSTRQDPNKMRPLSLWTAEPLQPAESATCRSAWPLQTGPVHSCLADGWHGAIVQDPPSYPPEIPNGISIAYMTTLSRPRGFP